MKTLRQYLKTNPVPVEIETDGQIFMYDAPTTKLFMLSSKDPDKEFAIAIDSPDFVIDIIVRCIMQITLTGKVNFAMVSPVFALCKYDDIINYENDIITFDVTKYGEYLLTLAKMYGVPVDNEEEESKCV